MANSKAGERIGGVGRQRINRRKNLGRGDGGARKERTSHPARLRIRRKEKIYRNRKKSIKKPKGKR